MQAFTSHKFEATSRLRVDNCLHDVNNFSERKILMQIFMFSYAATFTVINFHHLGSCKVKQ